MASPAKKQSARSSAASSAATPWNVSPVKTHPPLSVEQPSSLPSVSDTNKSTIGRLAAVARSAQGNIRRLKKHSPVRSGVVLSPVKSPSWPFPQEKPELYAEKEDDRPGKHFTRVGSLARSFRSLVSRKAQRQDTGTLSESARCISRPDVPQLRMLSPPSPNAQQDQVTCRLRCRSKSPNGRSHTSSVASAVPNLHMPSQMKKALGSSSPPKSFRQQQSERIRKSRIGRRVRGDRTPSPVKVPRSSPPGSPKWPEIPERFRHLDKIPPVKLEPTPPVVFRKGTDPKTIKFNPNAGPDTAKAMGIVEPEFPRMDFDRMLREWTSEERVTFMSSVELTEHDRKSMEWDAFFPITRQEDIDAILDEKYGKLPNCLDEPED
eukprot:scpid89540/ scgid20562/ 